VFFLAAACVELLVSSAHALPPSQSAQRLDELRGNRMIGPRILTSDKLAIGNYLGLEINRPVDDLAASRFECIRHVEIHLRAKDVFSTHFSSEAEKMVIL
jgi:hypothetical protein